MQPASNPILKTPPVQTGPVLPSPITQGQYKYRLNTFKVSSLRELQPLQIKPTDMTISDFYKSHGKKCLTHFSLHLVNTVSILQTGNLAPYESYNNQKAGAACHGNSQYVYFWGNNFEQSPESINYHSNSYFSVADKEWGSLDKVTFVHDLSVLDRQPFYTGSMYGQRTKKSFSTVPSVQTGNLLSAQVLSNEILVKGKVSNDSLMAIWVHKYMKDYFLEKFKQEGFEKIHDLPLADFINPEIPYPVKLWQQA